MWVTSNVYGDHDHDHLTVRKLAYSVGIPVTIGVDTDLVALVPAEVWQAA